MSLDSRIDALANIRGANDEQCTEHGKLLMLRDERDAGHLIECLDDGFVRLVDHMGNDSSIVQAARVNYGEETMKVSDDRNLIRYLMRHRHTTPFRMVETVWHVRVPTHVWQQWIQHPQASEGGELKWLKGQSLDSRTSAEYPLVRGREVRSLSREVYEEQVRLGVASEQARTDLPPSIYIEAHWKIDGHDLLRFLRLRMGRNVTRGIQTYSNAIARIIKSFLPMTWEAFEDYRLNAMTLSHQEQQEIRRLLHPEWSFCLKPFAGREREEFDEKIAWLGFGPPCRSNEGVAVQPA